MDPLLIDLCSGPRCARYFVKFADGEQMCAEGEHSYYAFLLLRGAGWSSQGGDEFTRVSREGSFLGEIATLTSMPRTASMHAGARSTRSCSMPPSSSASRRKPGDRPAHDPHARPSPRPIPADGLEKRR